MKKILKEYRVEITIILLVILGIFLLIERVQLQAFLTAGLQAIQAALKRLLLLIKTGVKFYIFSLSPSDFIGWVFLILAAVLAVWWVRYRFRHSETWQETNCPKCSSQLHRVHRKYFDRFLSRTFLPHARRYQCSNPECGWTGLRHPQRRHHHQESPDEKRENPR